MDNFFRDLTTLLATIVMLGCYKNARFIRLTNKRYQYLAETIDKEI
jgi:hypothetical protein